MDSQQDKYARAAERVAAMRKFYGKLGSYILFSLIFAGFNYYTNEFRNPWFLWIVGFWGLGITIEAFKLFGTNIMFGRNWEQRKIEEEMRKQDQDTFRSNRY